MANILIVDDSKYMRTMLADILTGDGHEIAGEAENAWEALEFHKRLMPDIITLDIVMPEVKGIDAITALKQIIHSNAKTRVIMVSAMGQEDVVKECLQEGASDFIIKPFKPDQVSNIVRKTPNTKSV